MGKTVDIKMKKMFFLLALSSIWVNLAYSQTISSDEVNSEGIRHIHGSLEVARDFKDREVFFVGLSAMQIDTIYNYFLHVKVIEIGPYSIPKEAVLLLKTNSGEVITLHAMCDSDASVRDVHSVNGYAYSDYSTIATYPITKQQLLLLINGVSKIRQETLTGTHNKEYNKDKIGKILKEEYEMISKALLTPKSIYDGF